MPERIQPKKSSSSILYSDLKDRVEKKEDKEMSKATTEAICLGVLLGFLIGLIIALAHFYPPYLLCIFLVLALLISTAEIFEKPVRIYKKINERRSSYRSIESSEE
jgi:uncharacterized membrane protein